MTHDQWRAYWHLIGKAARAEGATTPESREAVRARIHEQAFGRPVSAKEIDHLKMFDAFKAAALAIIEPDSLDAQLAQTEQPLIRLRHACRALADDAYIAALVTGPRFKKDAIEDLNEEELEHLRNTLAARRSAKHKKEADVLF
jgi:hypothetical protein